MSWYDDLAEKLTDTTGDLFDAYTEAEIEKISYEPANTANVPTQNSTASAAKYSDVIAANAVDQQAVAASEANVTFIDKYGKWLAVGGGTLLTLGAFIIVAKGK